MSTSKEGKTGKITGLEEKRRLAGKRIAHSMPAMIDKIKERREKEAWKLRKIILEREENQKGLH